MSMNVTLTLDDETAAYLKRIATDQGRSVAEVAAWIVTEDLRHERAIDAQLVAQLEGLAVDNGAPLAGSPVTSGDIAHRERPGT